MNALLCKLGLHLDQQSLSNLVAKLFGLAGLVAGGTLNVAYVINAGFGYQISMAANDRLKFWAVALGALVTYFTSQNTDQRAARSSSGVKLPMILVAMLGAGLLVSSCANNPPIANAANASYIAAISVDGVIQAEAAAFKAGAYSTASHQTYVAGLLKIAQGERALNDALKTWNLASGQPAPAVVALALTSLRTIVADLTPLIPTNSTIGALVASATTAINLITGGK